MIERFRIDGGVNDYAIIQEPDNHEDERKLLISEGYQLWSRYVKDGKKEELWVK